MTHGTTLAIFDFDGTITNRDTLLEFLIFAFGRRKVFSGLALLTPYLLMYKLRIIPNWKAKEKLLTYFLRDFTTDSFERVTAEFAVRAVPRLVRQSAWEKLQEHKAQGHDIVIVSASPESWVCKWAQQIPAVCLGTKLEVAGDRMTGKLSGGNCYGPEKVSRLRSALRLDAYANIYAYGDSRGDKEMLALATHKNYRVFR